MNDCYCDFDLPEFYRKTTHKARKTHRCSECFGAILKGETYRLAIGKWDGDFATYKECPDCMMLREQIGCKCYIHGGLHEDVTNMPFENYYEQFKAYRKVRISMLNSLEEQICSL